MGIGLGVITGTLIKVFTPQIRHNNSITSGWSSNRNSQTRKTDNFLNSGNFEIKKEIKPLSDRWESLAIKQKGLEASAFMLILDNGSYAKLDPHKIMPAASSIKTHILIAILHMIDKGQLSWNSQLTLLRELIGGEAGWMEHKPVGTKFPTHEVATEMIRVSDNTATNLLINRAGGNDYLNEYFKSLGLKATVLNNLLPDMKGTNTTSTYDLSRSIALVDTGKILRTRARDLFREVLSTSQSNRLLPAGFLKGLGVRNLNEPDQSLQIKGYRIFNKTGDIGISYADAGLIEMPNGTRAVAAFIVRGPYNDPRSPKLIRDMASAMATFLKVAPQSN